MESNVKKALVAMGIFIVFLVTINAILLTWKNKRINELKQTEKLYQATQDSLKTVRNALNQEVSKTELLTSENTTLFLTLQIRDKEIIRLQNVIKKAEKEKKDVNTALTISNETVIKLQDSIRSLIIGYTSPIDSPEIKYPVYKREFEKVTNGIKWTSGTVVMGIDTLSINQLVHNEYDITIGTEKIKGKLFKRKGYAEITNLNPDTETTVMKVYQQKEVKTGDGKKIGIAGVVGLLIGILL